MVQWAVGLDEFLAGIGDRFARRETRLRAFAYVRGLLSSLERKNGWTLTGLAGDTSVTAMQNMLQSPCWDPDEVRDDVRHGWWPGWASRMGCWSLTRPDS